MRCIGRKDRYAESLQIRDYAPIVFRKASDGSSLETHHGGDVRGIVEAAAVNLSGAGLGDYSVLGVVPDENDVEQELIRHAVLHEHQSAVLTRHNDVARMRDTTDVPSQNQIDGPKS